MTRTDRTETRIVRIAGRLTAELPGGEVVRYGPREVGREDGAPVTLCSTFDHLVAAAGW